MKTLAILFIIISSICYAEEEKKIALLFLTRSDLNQTQIWKEWVDFDKYNVYNHSKEPCSDPWFANFRISEIYPTRWGDILYAERALLKAALQDPKNYKFVLLSESCIPLRPTEEVYNILTSCPESHMRVVGPWWGENSSRALKEFPKENRKGNHTWIILNRKHAEMVVKDNIWIHCAAQHPIADEAYPSTFFSMKGLLHEFRNEFTTYVDWRRGKKGHPYLFSKMTEENRALLALVRQNMNPSPEPSIFLFARKFSPEFPAEEIRKLIWQRE